MKLLPSIVVLGWLAGVEAGAQTTPGARVPITREEVRQAIARQLQTKTGIGETSWPRAGPRPMTR